MTHLTILCPAYVTIYGGSPQVKSRFFGLLEGPVETLGI